MILEAKAEFLLKEADVGEITSQQMVVGRGLGGRWGDRVSNPQELLFGAGDVFLRTRTLRG